MMGIPKLIGYSLAVLFFTLILVTSTFVTQIQLAYAGGKSPYESGYDHGCDDAKISDPDDRYINQPEKGPSFHTDEFMDGYDAGFDNCSDDGYDENGDTEDDSDDRQRSSGGGLGSYTESYDDGYHASKWRAFWDRLIGKYEPFCSPSKLLEMGAPWCLGFRNGYTDGYT